MTPRPAGATNIENDGTFWKCEKNMWFFWNEHFHKWCAYVGPVNKNFIDVRTPLLDGEA